MKQRNTLPVGKLPSDLLGELLKRYVALDSRVIVGPGIGEDAAIIDMGARCLVAKTDPVTFAIDEIGWYAVHVNANDVACTGAKPRWYLATVLLPQHATSRALVETIFRQLSEACADLGISLCGGHTEITVGLDRPIVVGQMLGEVDHDRVVTTSGARVGDAVILTKGIAVEGTALVAREKADVLRNVASAGEIARFANFLHEPGISVVRDAQLALEAGRVHALHDPTEGGVATGLWELAQAADARIVVDEASLPVLPECELCCRHLGLDPLGLIGSGSLLIAADAGSAESIISRLSAEQISACVIGEITGLGANCSLRAADGTLRPLPRFERDEVARLFE